MGIQWSLTVVKSPVFSNPRWISLKFVNDPFIKLSVILFVCDLPLLQGSWLTQHFIVWMYHSLLVSHPMINTWVISRLSLLNKEATNTPAHLSSSVGEIISCEIAESNDTSPYNFGWFLSKHAQKLYQLTAPVSSEREWGFLLWTKSTVLSVWIAGVRATKKGSQDRAFTCLIRFISRFLILSVEIANGIVFFHFSFWNFIVSI